MLHSVDWRFVTDVLWQPVGPLSRGQAAQEDCLTGGDGIDRLSRNVCYWTANLWPAWSLKMGLISCSEMSITNNRCTLRNVSEEPRPHLHSGRIPKLTWFMWSDFILKWNEWSDGSVVSYGEGLVDKGAMYIRVTLYCRHLILLWLFRLGISCTVFVLICTVVVLYCFVVCVCMCGFCNMWVFW
jgi:hypothetical protein